MITTLMNRLNTLNKLALYGLFLFAHSCIHIYNATLMFLVTSSVSHNISYEKPIIIISYIFGYLILLLLITVNFKIIQRAKRIEQWLLIGHFTGCILILPIFWLIMTYEIIFFTCLLLGACFGPPH